MPEGPSIVILRELCQSFEGKVVREAEGNSKLIDPQRMVGRKVLEIRSWGKHFLLRFSGFSLRVHFMLFGSYRINERKEATPRLALRFRAGELNFYACSVKYIEEPLDQVYDWNSDVMSPQWDPLKARRKLKATPDVLACDALLDQSVFAGVGNIIKNEVLFRIRVHPLSTIGALPPRKLGQLIEQAREYSFDFLEWKKAYVLRKHWLAHRKTICPRCDIRLHREHLGKTHRRSFYCDNCQRLYAAAGAQVKTPTTPTRAKRPLASVVAR